MPPFKDIIESQQLWTFLTHRKWAEYINRGWLRELEQKEKGVMKAARVRKQGGSCPHQPRNLKVFKYMNRQVGQACCSAQAFALSVSQDLFSLQRVQGYPLFVFTPSLYMYVVIMNSYNVLL